MDLYKILQVDPTCSTNDIKKSYYKLAKIYHPDKNGDVNKFQQINYAYNILIDENSRIKYNTMNTDTKDTLIVFLEEWFKNNPNIKSFFNLSNDIFTNIENYNFNDIIAFFNNNITPKKTFQEHNDCSDSEIDNWDESMAEYYDKLPLKYHQYNVNNINIELTCSIEELLKNNIRKIKIHRKYFDIKTINNFCFYNKYRFIVFNMGGDINNKSSGHLIIQLIFPNNYSIESNIINYNHSINLYEFIYGVDINIDIININFDIKQWIPFRDGMSILLKTINNTDLILKMNLNYIDSIDKREILNEYFKQ